jgi:4-hydroxy-tetrahydrodipicolinate synthase
MSASKVLWKGVYPAATTQFAQDLSIDYDATQGCNPPSSRMASTA